MIGFKGIFYSGPYPADGMDRAVYPQSPCKSEDSYSGKLAFSKCTSLVGLSWEFSQETFSEKERSFLRVLFLHSGMFFVLPLAGYGISVHRCTTHDRSFTLTEQYSYSKLTWNLLYGKLISAIQFFAQYLSIIELYALIANEIIVVEFIKFCNYSTETRKNFLFIRLPSSQDSVG